MGLPYGTRVSISGSNKTSILHPKNCFISGQSKKILSNNNIKCSKPLIGYSKIKCSINYTTIGKYCKLINGSA